MRTTWAKQWLDEVVVERAVVGYPPGRDLTKWELREAVRRLISQDAPAPVIRERLGVSDATIQYWRERIRQGRA